MKILLTLMCIFIFKSARAEVHLSGLSDADAAHIKKRFPDLNADKPQLSILDDVIRYLTQLETYASVRLETDETGELFLKAVPLKRVGEIKISGHSKFDRDDILAALGIKVGAQFDKARIIEAAEKLKEFYGQRGYFNAIVSFDLHEMPKNELSVQVKIREREPCLVQNIEIELDEKNVELQQRLIKRVRKYINKNFTEENTANIEAAMIDHLKSNRFLNSKLQQKEARYNQAKTRVTLVYQLTDPYSYQVLIKGGVHYTSARLLKNVKFEELASGNSDMAQDITQMIRNYYISTGFAHVKLSFYSKTIPESFTKQIHIEIEEGPRVKIEALEIVGRISRPTAYYSDFILENSSEAVKDDFYIRADLENGYKNLITHLNNQGYLKAKIQSARVDYNPKKDGARITVVLDEGPLTKLTAIGFYGIKSFAETQLLEQLSIRSQSPLRLNDLEKSIENLKKFYYDRGFIEMKILNENESLVQYQERDLLASIYFKIEEGPQVYIKGISIEGNTFTRDDVILREADIEVGDLVTPELLDDVKKRLDKLGIFSHVDLHTLEANTPVSQRILIISVTERNPGLFRFGAGLTNKRRLTIRGFSGLSYNNIGGTARAVSIRGTLEKNLVEENQLEYEVSVGYLEPFLFNKRLRGRANYSRSEKIIESDDQKMHATDSITFSVEKDITANIKFTWLVWGFDSVEQFDVPATGPLKRESRQEIAYIGPSLDIDFRDNPFLPTEGTYTKLDAEYSAPALGSSEKIQFVRTQGTFSHYLRVGSPRVVWANSFRSGYEKNLSDRSESGVPVSFAFFLGGYTSVRGFSGSRGDRIPSSAEFPNDEESQLIIPGESSFYLVKSELRFPLWSELFGGVLFYDGGQVNIQGFDFEHPYHHSFGVGLRINTPVGPVSLDYARKINPQQPKEPDQWHFTFGTF